MKRKFKKLVFVAAVAASASAMATTVGEWNYNLVPNGIGSNNLANLNPAYRKAKAQLFQEGASYTFRMQGTGVDDCFARELASTIEKAADTLTITPVPSMGACPRVRLVLKNDGSGGQVLVNIGKRSDVWAEDENDYGLTRR